MNYRHAFHAGNFADCAKHALLLEMLEGLRRKPAPFAVLDTHAGPGAVAVETDAAATRTGEWRAGIGRLLRDPPPALAAYVGAVRASGLYPGSPSLIRSRLRDGDRLIACELHPEDHATLRARFGGDPLVAVHRRDGYEALQALLPPAQKRGLVLIDPPFERTDEFARLAGGLAVGMRRFAGTFAVWYPIKGRAPSRSFHEAVRAAGLRDVLAAELWLRPPDDTARLNGAGLLVARPGFGFGEAASAILPALLERLDAERGAGWAVTRVCDE